MITLSPNSLRDPAKMAENWPRFGGPRPSWQLGWAVNWIGSAPVQISECGLDGCCCDGAMSCCWLWLSCAYLSFLVDGQLGCWPRKVSPSGLQWTGRRAELLGIKLGFPHSQCHAVISDVLCVRSYVHFVCVCVYMCLCICVRTCIYIYICACVYVYVCACNYLVMREVWANLSSAVADTWEFVTESLVFERVRELYIPVSHDQQSFSNCLSFHLRKNSLGFICCTRHKLNVV